MDAISLLQTAVPLVVAIIFTGISAVGLEGLLVGQVANVLTPIWCFVAGFSWIGYAIVNLYGLTLDYFSAFSWLYLGLGLLFNILAVVALIKDLHLAAKTNTQAREEDEMRLN